MCLSSAPKIARSEAQALCALPNCVQSDWMSMLSLSQEIRDRVTHYESVVYYLTLDSRVLLRLSSFILCKNEEKHLKDHILHFIWTEEKKNGSGYTSVDCPLIFFL